MSGPRPSPAPELLEVIRDVKGPRPVLSRADEATLTDRQRQILDKLHEVFSAGFGHLTMAGLAAELSCSLRTLYGLASSRDELVLMVVDRNLWRVGRTAMAAVEPTMAPLDAIRAYLRAANVAVAGITEAFAADAEANAPTASLNAAHSEYIIDVTRALLDLAIERGDIAPIDTAPVARVMAGVGAEFSRAEVLPTLSSSAKDAADTIVDVILRGLPRPDDVPQEQPCR